MQPLEKSKAEASAQPIYDELSKKFGRMPNIFGLMARRPEALKVFLPLYGAVMGDAALPERYKELAYITTSILNGCEY